MTSFVDFILKRANIYDTPDFLKANGEYAVKYSARMKPAPTTACALWIYEKNTSPYYKDELDFSKSQFPQVKRITIAMDSTGWIENVVFTSMYYSINITPITLLDLPSLVSIEIMDNNYMRVKKAAFIGTFIYQEV